MRQWEDFREAVSLCIMSLERETLIALREKSYFFFFFLREFQPMASAPDDSSLSSNQDTNQFFM